MNSAVSDDVIFEEKRQRLIAKQYAANQRQREKQLAKLNDPEYVTQQKIKQQQAFLKHQQKQQQKQQCPEFRQQQREKAQTTVQKAQRKQQQTALQIRQKKPHHAKSQTQEQIEKKQQQWQASQLRQRQKQQQKLLDPAFQQQLKNKKLEALQRQQHKQALKQQQKPTTVPTPQSRSSIKSKGLKGRPYNAQEKRLAAKLASIGCICCINQGWVNAHSSHETGLQFISLHHVEGRTKPWAHAKVLPLCHYHHQTEAPANAPADLFPLHGNAKTRWEQVNGTQTALLDQAYRMINETQPWRANETSD